MFKDPRCQDVGSLVSLSGSKRTKLAPLESSPELRCEMLNKLTRGTKGGPKGPIGEIVGGKRREDGATKDDKRREVQMHRQEKEHGLFW